MLFSVFNAAMIPMDSRVFPEPPRKAAIMSLGICIPSGCIDYSSNG
jgi:hypothetical protein